LTTAVKQSHRTTNNGETKTNPKTETMNTNLVQTAFAAGVFAVSLLATAAEAQATDPASAKATAEQIKKPNIVFIIVDQRTYRLFTGDDYSLPAFDAIARHGVTFRNHYIASAMCSPSRASFLTGRPPQVHGVFDQMHYPFTPSLSPDLPNMGSVLKGLGYKTAYFGKFEMDKKLMESKSTVNYSAALQLYGFDVFSAGGDIGSEPLSGFDNDPFIAGEAVRWLHASATEARRTGQPFFMVASFLNPHDIMYGNANIPGQPAVEKAVSPKALPPLPPSSIYQKQWSVTLPPSLDESLTARVCPKHFWNTATAGSVGRAPSPPVANICGP
jgi:arylsulfatase A-like enzyme